MLRTITATRYIAPLREGGSLPAIVEADQASQLHEADTLLKPLLTPASIQGIVGFIPETALESLLKKEVM